MSNVQFTNLPAAIAVTDSDIVAIVQSNISKRATIQQIKDTLNTGGGTVSGTGTANQVAKWSDPTTIEDSIIQDDGTEVVVDGNIKTADSVIVNSANETYWGYPSKLKVVAPDYNYYGIVVQNEVANNIDPTYGVSISVYDGGSAEIYSKNSNYLVISSTNQLRLQGTTVTSNSNFDVVGKISSVLGILPRISYATINSPLVWDSSNDDYIQLSPLNINLTISADSGTPDDGQKIVFRLKDNGTPRTLSWTTGSPKSFRAIGVTLPTTTVANKWLYVGCVYNNLDSRWDVVAVAQES